MKYNTQVVLAYFKECGLPAPETEFRFHSARKWRFDFAWPDKLIALEVEGAVWTGGRHTRGSGFKKDIDKYNNAGVLGWRVFRTTPEELCMNETVEMLRKVL